MVTRVTVLATGGTISSRGASGQATPTARAQDLLVDLEPLPEGVEVVGLRDVKHVISPALSLADMADIVEAAVAVAGSGDTDGIVVTHGTATVIDTAFLAYLVWRHDVGIAFTGAMATNSRISRDGPRNIRDSILAAADTRLRGAGPTVVVNGTIHSPRFVAKRHKSAFNAFTSGDHGTFGYVDDDLVRVTASLGSPPRLPLVRPVDTDVYVIKAYPGMPDLLLRAAVEAGARGIVLECLPGRGGVPPALQATLEAALDAGLPVVLAGDADGRIAGTYRGAAHARHYLDRGAIPGGDLSTSRARTLLSLLLADGADVGRVRRTFGEIAP